MVLMFEKKKKDKKNEDLMKKAPAENAVALSCTDLEATAGGYGIYAQDGKRVALAGVWPDNSRQSAYFNTRDEALEYAKKNGIR